MQTKFKRHQLVRILRSPDPNYIEYNYEEEGLEKLPIEKGMIGKINILLPNFQYHVAILHPKDKTKILAYAPFSEEDLEELDEDTN